MYLLYVHTIYFGYSWAIQSYEIFVFCLSVKQYGSSRGSMKPIPIFRVSLISRFKAPQQSHHARHLAWRNSWGTLNREMIMRLTLKIGIGVMLPLLLRQKSCSAKPLLWDFEACTLFQKQVPSGGLSLYLFSGVWSLSCPNSTYSEKTFCCCFLS